MVVIYSRGNEVIRCIDGEMKWCIGGVMKKCNDGGMKWFTGGEMIMGNGFLMEK